MSATSGPRGAISGAVYDPPRADLPALAVAFDPDGEVLAARAVPSADAGQAFLELIFSQFASAQGRTVVRS